MASVRPFGLGMTMAQVAALLAETDPTVTMKAVPNRVGRPRKDDEGKGSNRTIKRGTTRDYTLARLRRDDPQTAGRVERGELTAHAAARAAGIVREPDPYRQLCKWWGKASDEQRARFEDFIAQWRRKEAA